MGLFFGFFYVPHRLIPRLTSIPMFPILDLRPGEFKATDLTTPQRLVWQGARDSKTCRRDPDAATHSPRRVYKTKG